MPCVSLTIHHIFLAHGRIMATHCAYTGGGIRVTELGLDSATRTSIHATGREHGRRGLVLSWPWVDAHTYPSTPAGFGKFDIVTIVSASTLFPPSGCCGAIPQGNTNTSFHEDAPDLAPVLRCLCQVQTQLRPAHAALLSLRQAQGPVRLCE